MNEEEFFLGQAVEEELNIVCEGQYPYFVLFVLYQVDLSVLTTYYYEFLLFSFLIYTHQIFTLKLSARYILSPGLIPKVV